MKRATVMAMAVAMAAGGVRAQPVQWRVQDGGNGHWYQIVITPSAIRWTEARQTANSLGGDLACIATQEEYNFIVPLLLNAYDLENCFPLVYIGLVQLSGQPWTWIDGSPFEWSVWGNNTDPAWPQGKIGSFSPGAFEPYCVPHLRWDDSALDALHPLHRGVFVEWSADCNNDGIVDKGQILSGELVDANNNGIPDGPAITSQPTDQASAEGALVSFNVQVVPPPNCTTPVTYRWQRRNPAISDPAAPGAWFDLVDDGTFANTDRPTMTVLRPGPAIATGHRCKIGGGCGCEPGQGGFVYSNTVNFSVACPADFNADGGIDFGDVEAFFERWENGC